MDVPCRLGLLLLCLTGTALCESTVGSQIRDSIGLGSSASQTDSPPPNAVFVFLNDGWNLTADSGLEEGELLSLGEELEQRDPSAVFAHYNGDRVITSHASLFNDLDATVGDSSFGDFLGQIKVHRGGKRGNAYPDLIVMEAYPEQLRGEVAELCGGGSEKGSCKVVNAFVNDGTRHLRFRRADTDTTTAASGTPGSMTPQQRANIPLDSVAAFHLLFWTSLAIALTVWGTAYGMWHMDPGRDSIIYRMTSAQKFKKDK